MQTWLQNYSAIGGNLWLTAAVAVLPIVFFFVALLAPQKEFLSFLFFRLGALLHI